MKALVTGASDFIGQHLVHCLEMHKIKVNTLANVLLVHLIDELLFKITIPGKTQSYLACGKLILMSVKGNAANLVLEAGASLVARPSDPLDLAHVVREFYKRSPDQRISMETNGREYFLKHLTIERCLDKYETLFQKVINSFTKC